MALSDGPISVEENELLNARVAARQEAIARAAAVDAARLSKPELAQDKSTYYTYVIVDDEVARIQKVRSQETILRIPETLGGKPVAGISYDAFAKLETVEELYCPDSIVSIGGGAFRGCLNLRKVVLPGQLSDFNSGWFTFCEKVEELTLPGQWERILASVFDFPKLTSLHIGAGTQKVEPGAFQKSKLSSITIDADNPYLKTDGQGIYSADGEQLLVLAVPSETYIVQEGCKLLARKAFSTFSELTRVDLPDSVEDIAEFAYSRTGLQEFTAPASLYRIREKAFFNCKGLTKVALNEGLGIVGQEAFSSTPITELRFPRTIETIERNVAAGTKVVFSGPEATFTVPEDALYLSLDDKGVLYSTQSGEKVLVQVVEPALTQMKVQEGTKRIAEQAARNHKCLEAVKMPEGLEVIEREAFKGCRQLYWVEIPDSVWRIEDEAFLDTTLQHVNLPASLTYLGPMAFITYGAHHTGTLTPTLKEIIIPESLKERYFTVPGLLCQRREDGTVRIMVCLGAENITLPPETTSIDDYAFANMRGIRELVFSNRIRSIGVCGFAIDCWVEHIHVDLVEPMEGHDHFDFYFPFNDRAMQQIKLTFGMMRSVDIQRLFATYDQVICNGAGLQGGHGDSGMTLYDQAQRVLARLAEPIFMSRVHRQIFLSFLKNSIEDISVEIARKDDRRSFDTLLDFGYLNDDNLLRVIDRVGTIQDAAMTGYLLEVRRRLFNKDIIDFDL